MPDFEAGGRCFFVGAATFALAVVALWIVRLGVEPGDLPHLGAAGHAREMLFG